MQLMNNALNTLSQFGDNVDNLSKKSSDSYFNSLHQYFNIHCKNISLTSSPNSTITVLDSGAFPHMFMNKNYFTTLTPWPSHLPIQHVTLTDGKAKVNIEGIGTVRVLLNNLHSIELINTLLVPTLSTNLFSIKEFMQY